MARAPELVIFDCDGVLIDSEIIGINLTLRLLESHGVTMGFHEFASEFSGLSWDELIDKVRDRQGVAVPASINGTFYALLQEEFAQKLTRTDGTLEVLRSLDFPKCICSNSSSSQIDYALTLVGLKPLFPGGVFSAVDLGPGRAKPQPDIYLHAARVMNAAPENTLVIEDSVHGVTAASRAGMAVIGYIGGAHTYPLHGEKLRAAGAGVIIQSMYQLPAEIARFISQRDIR
ncbi:HAD family hydrolase [Klebsiella sp. NPDC088457]